MATLWQKEYQVDDLVHRFTVGNDYLLDRRLVAADCAGSLAHAIMLNSIGVISATELDELRAGLLEIVTDYERDAFEIKPQDEDCHTAIENRLTERFPEAGAKIHTGRSRNDQVLTATRIYLRSALLELTRHTISAVHAFLDLASAHQQTPMPGRTHLQTAMPSSVGLWAASFADALLDDLTLLQTALDLADRSPLGAAASYGVPLPLDRELTARLLGFASVHGNVLAVNNSRGKIEAIALDAADSAVSTVSKAAVDLILFSLPEFGYFELPVEMCTGSSIMPQKKNPDVLELTRARAGTLSGIAVQLKNAVRNLPSGYNRDLQETKEPMLRGMDIACGVMEIMAETVRRLRVNPDALARACTPELFATDEAFALVQQGVPFRDAYRRIAAGLDEVQSADPVAALARRTSTGTPGNLGLDTLRSRLADMSAARDTRCARVDAALAGLFGRDVVVLGGR